MLRFNVFVAINVADGIVQDTKEPRQQLSSSRSSGAARRALRSLSCNMSSAKLGSEIFPDASQELLVMAEKF
ncbi:MAG: hypothetical protein ONB46_22460 [candidate division KSB1 bacterium]|nr:hypothetical protein [candidate division KSB1 bacterium]MDZ7368549.1 hypothetical protein [candidate division KSB1 bacterium]MDZ7406413.1 hypothetical protein [candidate division KSB1 bacterium]